MKRDPSGFVAAAKELAEIGHRALAVGHQQQGAFALAQRAAAGLEFVACLVGLDEEHGVLLDSGKRTQQHRTWL